VNTHPSTRARLSDSRDQPDVYATQPTGPVVLRKRLAGRVGTAGRHVLVDACQPSEASNRPGLSRRCRVAAREIQHPPHMRGMLVSLSTRRRRSGRRVGRVAAHCLAGCGVYVFIEADAAPSAHNDRFSRPPLNGLFDMVTVAAPLQVVSKVLPR
jgi:hypothetical protein